MISVEWNGFAKILLSMNFSKKLFFIIFSFSAIISIQQKLAQKSACRIKKVLYFCSRIWRNVLNILFFVFALIDFWVREGRKNNFQKTFGCFE